MATWIDFIRTNQGLNLDTKIAAGGVELTITKAMSAAGKVSATKLREQTALTTPKQTLQIMDKQILSDSNAFILPIKLTNAGLTEGYDMYQLGIFAQDPDLGEILYMICQTSTPEGEEVPSETDQPAYSIQWNMKITISDATNVTVEVSDVGNITQDQADARYSAKSKRFDTTLSHGSWSGETYTVSNSLITSETQIVEMGVPETITKEQLAALQAANIISTAQAAGSITLKAMGTVPTIDIPVFFIARGDI